MKKIYITSLMALSLFSAGAGVLDLQSRRQLLEREQLRQPRTSVAGSVRQKAQSAKSILTGRETTLAFVKIEDGYTADDLRADGINVLTVRGNVAIAEVPYSEAEVLAAKSSVKLMQFERPVNVKMDIARAVSGTDVIHEGADGLPRAYTGKGVLAAIVDQGMDPNHVNFLDADGENRIKYLAQMRYNAMGTDVAPVYYGSDVKDARPISEFTTDDQSTYHGTHTLGIMAGSYKGALEVSEGTDALGESIVKTVDNPYYGVATDADLAVSCGLLTDVCIAYGMDYMYGYGVEYRQMPMVYNLSLGSNTGAHDPRSSMSEFLDAVGEETIICVSAGNEGDSKAALNKTLSESDNTIKTFIHPKLYHYEEGGQSVETQNTWRYGNITVYGDDDTEFQVRVVLYRKSRNYRVAYEMPAVSTDTYKVYCTDDSYGGDVVAPANGPFATYFDGYVAIARMLDPATNRFYCDIQLDIIDKEANSKDEEMLVGLEVTGTAGHRYDVYSDATTVSFDNYGIEGFDDGSRNGTLSDMAVGYNLVTVGSYNTRQEWTTLDGGKPSYPGDGFRPGYVSDFSSFSTLADGRNLPLVCAPGSAVISSMSLPYMEYYTDYLASQTGVKLTDAMRREYYDYLCSGRATGADGKIHYWKQEVGTSMSTPFVAGNIALWLEADPTLKIQDVQDIIARTAMRDEYVEAGDPVQWGAGKFDALAGLKEVIRNTGIVGVSSGSHNDRLMVTSEGSGRFNVFVGGATAVDVALTSMSGSVALRQSGAGDELSVDASSLPAGVYVLTANGHSQKIVLR